MKCIAIAALALLFDVALAQAGLFTGKKLADFCDDQSAHFKDGVCVGYIFGVLDHFEAMKMLFGNQLPMRICKPHDVTVGQTRSVVHAFLKEHPEMLHERADSLVLIAMRDAFPCER